MHGERTKRAKILRDRINRIVTREDDLVEDIYRLYDLTCDPEFEWCMLFLDTIDTGLLEYRIIKVGFTDNCLAVEFHDFELTLQLDYMTPHVELAYWYEFDPDIIMKKIEMWVMASPLGLRWDSYWEDTYQGNPYEF